MAQEDWQLCVEWLLRCQILPSDHKLVQSHAQVFDLAQFIRDGVVLCHVLNHLSIFKTCIAWQLALVYFPTYSHHGNIPISHH